MNEEVPNRELDVLIAERVLGIPLLPKEVFDPDRCLYEADGFFRDEETGEFYCDEHISFADQFEEITDQKFFSRFPETPNESKKIRVPHYSAHLDTAWQVIEKLKADSWKGSIAVEGSAYKARFHFSGPEILQRNVFTATAETAPLAICRAALKIRKILYQKDKKEADNGQS